MIIIIIMIMIILITVTQHSCARSVFVRWSSKAEIVSTLYATIIYAPPPINVYSVYLN